MDKFKDNFINIINSLPYKLGLALKNSLIFLFNIFVFLCIKITTLYVFLISSYKKSSKLTETGISSNYSYENIYKITNQEIVKLFLNYIKDIFYIENKIYLIVNDKKEILNLLLKIKTNKSLWIKINTLYGNYDFKLYLVPNFILYFLLLSTNEFALYNRYNYSNNRIIFGSESGCLIEIWINSNIHYLDKSEYKRKVYKIASPDWLKEKNLAIDSRNLNKIDFTPYKTDFPIDIVFTWVDGSDPDWKKSFDRTIKKYKDNELLVTSANESRFRSFNELKYAI